MINLLAVFLINKLIPPPKKTNIYIKKAKDYDYNNYINIKCFKSGFEQL